MCTLVDLLAKNFVIFLAKTIASYFLPSWTFVEGRWVHTFRCQKRCALRKSSSSSFCFCQMVWQGIEAPKQTSEFPAAPSFFWLKKMNQINTKNYWKQKKRLCVRLRWGVKHHLRKSADRKAQIRKAFVSLTALICAFRSADFLRWCLCPERNLTHNLYFYFLY